MFLHPVYVLPSIVLSAKLTEQRVMSSWVEGAVGTGPNEEGPGLILLGGEGRLHLC